MRLKKCSFALRLDPTEILDEAFAVCNRRVLLEYRVENVPRRCQHRGFAIYQWLDQRLDPIGHHRHFLSVIHRKADMTARIGREPPQTIG
jgi:hypothetical protein